MLTRKDIEELKRIYAPGTKIELIEMKGEDIPEGTVGTVIKVDDIGQIQMSWSTGSSLALQPEHDTFKVIKDRHIKL